jgi:DNA-binding NarL/FixJ family response regulator
VLPLRVAVVEDHRLLAQSLGLALQAAGHEAVLIDPTDDVPVRVAQWRPAVVLLDLNLGAGGTGDELVAVLGAVAPVLVLTGEDDRARWGRCLRAGAAGVLSKESDVEEVVGAVGRLAAGQPVVPDAERSTWLRAAERAERDTATRLAPFRRLTPREQDVLTALVDGMPAAAIAADAVVSEATVRTQIRAVLTKLGVGSQLQAVAAARRAGWSARRNSPSVHQS